MTTPALATAGTCTCGAPPRSRFHGYGCTAPGGIKLPQADLLPATIPDNLTLAEPAGPRGYASTQPVIELSPSSSDEELATIMHKCLVAMRNGMNTYLRLPDEAVRGYAAWIMHTHFRERQTETPEPGQLIWDATPRWLFVGDKNTGKSAAARLGLALVGNPDFIDVSPTIYGLAAALNEQKTVILDEAHRFFLGANGQATKHVDAQSIFTAGYTRDAVRRIGRSMTQVKMEVFGAMLLCARSVLLKAAGGEQLDDLLERCITVETEKVFPPPPPVSRHDKEQLPQLQEHMKFLGSDPLAQEIVLDLAESYVPGIMPAELDGRQRQLWTPLLACAALAARSPAPGATAHLPELLTACRYFTRAYPAAHTSSRVDALTGAFSAEEN
jgi:hypothetical protein